MPDMSPEAVAKRKAAWRAEDALCKNCRTNQKRNGSRYCQECSDASKKEKADTIKVN
jgi:hypothetical protein